MEKCVVTREKRRTFVCVHATCRVASLLFARRRAFLMSFRVLTKSIISFYLRGLALKTVNRGVPNYEPWKGEETANELKSANGKKPRKGTR